MKYRKLGRTELLVSEIGMGLEHLLDKEESIVVDTVRTAIEGGVNYLDCLSQRDFSKNPGVNEDYVKLGKALHGLRDRVAITYVANSLHSVDESRPAFECFLKELNTQHTDIFIIACCDKMTELKRIIGDNSLLCYARELKRQGKARYIGLSTHSSAVAYEAIARGNFDVLMYPINPAFDVVTDEEAYISDDLGKLWDAAYLYNAAENSGIPPRKNVYSECVRNGVGLVAMKPFAGGFLFRPDVNTGFTPLNLLSYALSQSGVSTVIPGCSSPSEIEEILTYYDVPIGALNYSGAVAKSRWSVKENCLYCNHCLPCSANIDIAQVSKLVDSFEDGVSPAPGLFMEKYGALEVKASACVECGDCMDRCPFQVKITEKMKRASKIFESASI